MASDRDPPVSVRPQDKADIWALGATLLELLSGKPLPQTGPAYAALRQGKLPLLPGVRMPVQALIQKMLHQARTTGGTKEAGERAHTCGGNRRLRVACGWAFGN